MNTPRLNILFVDDEIQVLDGLRRSLYSLRAEWDMRFAESGERALELLKETPCDIIISDMRMPGMNGGQLLAKVRQQFPETIRFMLSGQADDEDLLKNIGPIHQFLHKPCSAQTLRGTIVRAWQVHDRISSPEMRALASSLQSIPALPINHRALIAELENENANAESLGRIIARDVGMTAKIMQLVNSAFFGTSKRVTAPADAVTRLGLRTLKMVAVTFHLFDQFKAINALGISYEELWNRACLMANGSRRMASVMKLTPAQCDAAHLAGMLYELGRLVFACKFQKPYADAIEYCQTNGTSLTELERRQFGIRQGQLGGYVLGLWGFEEQVVDAVSFFECPSENLKPELSVLTALHLAAVRHSGNECQGRVEADTAYLKRVGLGESWEGYLKGAATAA